jgi:hypothetical protein
MEDCKQDSHPQIVPIEFAQQNEGLDVFNQPILVEGVLLRLYPPQHCAGRNVQVLAHCAIQGPVDARDWCILCVRALTHLLLGRSY